MGIFSTFKKLSNYSSINMSKALVNVIVLGHDCHKINQLLTKQIINQLRSWRNWITYHTRIDHIDNINDDLGKPIKLPFSLLKT